MARRTHANVCDMMSWHDVEAWHGVTSCRTHSHVRHDDIYLRRGHAIREAALHTDTHEQNHSRTLTRLIYVYVCHMMRYTCREGTTFEKPLCTCVCIFEKSFCTLFKKPFCTLAFHLATLHIRTLLGLAGGRNLYVCRNLYTSCFHLHINIQVAST